MKFWITNCAKVLLNWDSILYNFTLSYLLLKVPTKKGFLQKRTFLTHCVIWWNNSQHLILNLMFLVEISWIFIILWHFAMKLWKKELSIQEEDWPDWLKKYTIEDAKKIIKHCVEELPVMVYQHVKKILEEKYGSPYHVMVEYRKEFKVGLMIRSGDARGYQRFYNFLCKCESMTQSTHWNHVDLPDVICMLLTKLPVNTKEKWSIVCQV